jgi:hypothetical protein
MVDVASFGQEMVKKTTMVVRNRDRSVPMVRERLSWPCRLAVRPTNAGCRRAGLAAGEGWFVMNSIMVGGALRHLKQRNDGLAHRRLKCSARITWN